MVAGLVLPCDLVLPLPCIACWLYCRYVQRRYNLHILYLRGLKHSHRHNSKSCHNPLGRRAGNRKERGLRGLLHNHEASISKFFFWQFLAILYAIFGNKYGVVLYFGNFWQIFFFGLQDSCLFLSSKRAFRTSDEPEIRRNNGLVCTQ